MKKRTIFIIIGIVTVVAAIAIGVGVSVVLDLQQEKLLREEIENIESLDITKDRYNTAIKTKGDYAKVEESIKKFLDDYAVLIQDTLRIIEDERLQTMLSIENYQQDGKDFTSSKEYLTSTKETFNTNMQKLAFMTSEESVMSYINNKDLDEYYIDLYRELALGKNAKEELEKSAADLESAKDTFNNLLDTELNVLNFLSENQDQWSLTDTNILFDNAALLLQYNLLLANLK